MALLDCPVESRRAHYDLDMVSIDGCVVFVAWDTRGEPIQYAVGLIRRLCALQGLELDPEQHINDGVFVGSNCLRYQVGSFQVDYAWTRTPWLL